MSADLSRVRFDPLRDHSGIGSLQGRVWLDADFNEQVAITDRRSRAQVADLAPTPSIVSRLTPDAFKVTEIGGVVSIGTGRMYVDGLLAENHGKGDTFDPVLAEANGSGTIAYTDQPYRRDVKDLPESGGQHLFYLAVWQRELDYLNTPDLVEPAVGVETTTRTQTAWQVRVLPNVGTGLSCDSAITAWDNEIVLSSARLTTGTDDSDPPSGPCEMPPSKGYRGPENQLYRVELHSDKEFKWSRDNATVTSAVDKKISLSRLRLATLGRDEFLSIKSGDWVEVLDDRLELDRQPGEMRKVTVEEGNVIVLDADLPQQLADSTYHLRVRKWDSGPTKIVSGPMVLEHGVTVTFSFAGTGKPRPGDYWVFAARVADASVEELKAAPPRGIHVHYAKLALVSIGGPVTDCRPGWPVGQESCGCEVCVAPGESLQEAVEGLKKLGGGTLVLCPGTYELAEPLKLDGVRSLRVVGAGRASRIVPRNGGIVVTRSRDIVLSDFAIETEGDMPGVIFASANQNCLAQRLWLTHKLGPALALTGAQYALGIRECVFNTPIGISAKSFDQDSKGLLTFGLSIKDNLMACPDRGVDLGIDRHGVIQHTGLTAVTGNHVTASADTGIVVTGLVPQDVPDLDGALDISDNLLEVAGAGIVTGGRVRVNDNTIISAHRVEGRHGIALEASPPDTPGGVALVIGNKVSTFGGYGVAVSAIMESLVVKQNIVRGCAGGILVQPVTAGGRVSVDNNQILDLHPVREIVAAPLRPIGSVAMLAEPGLRATTIAAGAAGSLRAAAGATRAAASAVLSASRAAAATDETETMVLTPNRAAATIGSVAGALTSRISDSLTRIAVLIGIGVIGADMVVVAGNTIDGVAADEGDSLRYAYGIFVGACVDAKILGNLVARVGSAANGGAGYGIGCASWQDTVSVTNNTVRSGEVPETHPAWTPVMMVGSAGQTVNLLRTAQTSAGTWTFVGEGAYLRAAPPSGNVELTGNILNGGTEDPVLAVTTTGDVILGGNRCLQPGDADREAVRISAATAVAQGNRLKGGRPSLIITARSGATAVGNVTSGGIQINGNNVPNDALNPTG